jgi:hypothetical protein
MKMKELKRMLCKLLVLSGLMGAVIASGIDTGLGLMEPVRIGGDVSCRVVAPATGDKGWFNHGLVQKHDAVFDFRDIYSVRFDALNKSNSLFEGKIRLNRAKREGRRDMVESTQAEFKVASSPEWQTVDIPVTSFDYARGDDFFLKFIGDFQISGDRKGDVEIRNIRLIEAPTVKLSSYIRSKAAENGIAEYDISVKNCSGTVQDFRVVLVKTGWEGMDAALSRETLRLKPGETENIKLTVRVPSHFPGGLHERQVVKITSQNPGTVPAELEFITVQRVESPFLVHNQKGWDDLRLKIAKYEWAKKEFKEMQKAADKWTPPVKAGVKSDQGTTGVLRTRYEWNLYSCIVCWKVTGEEKYFKKIRDFLLMFSNPKDAYPVLLHATSQGIPQEGGTFELVAIGYDAVRDRLTSAEREQIEHTMRLYIDTLIDRLGDGGITNWTIFNQVPGAACALILHDLQRFNTLMYEPTGLINQFRYGIMDDGWWFEMSLSYNIHCAQGFTKLALFAKPFGIDLLNVQFPVPGTNLTGRRVYELSHYQGMNFQKFGPLRRNMLGFKAMWDAIIYYPDYRSVMFGMGDGHEELVGGHSFDLAYYAFRDPRYASIIKSSTKRDLVYGVAELPDDTPELYKNSANSHNAGITVLRSQSGDARDRIQAGFKYGTHGGYHGHFDHLSLLCLMRYGRGFYNPETSWYGYGSYMYKWWVQPSLAHNMVVVDGKMQEPSECRPLIFYPGRNMQVVAADSSTRWSNPPYLGGYDQKDGIKDGTRPYVPIPEDHPPVGDVTDYTEPVFQRRLQLVTDDYVVVADYAVAEQVHTFDNLLHLRGVKVLGGLKKTGHRPQFDDSPLSSGQFIVNVDEYDMTAPVKLTSLHRFNEKTSSGRNKKEPLELTDFYYHEPGELMIDAYMVWPRKAQMLIADYAESQPVGKRLHYEVKGDGKILAEGIFHAWILGKGEIDVDISGVKELVLSTTKDKTVRNVADTLFWADAVLETADGKNIRLSKLKHTTDGLKKQPAPGVDYYGDPVRIAGTPYLDIIGAEPVVNEKAGTICFDLSGLKATRLKACVGGDFPAGQEDNLRKTTSVRNRGKEARFVTVLEPHEGQKRVKSVRAVDADTIEVTLVDNTVDLVKLSGLYSRNDIPSVELYRNGKLLEKTEQR